MNETLKLRDPASPEDGFDFTAIGAGEVYIIARDTGSAVGEGPISRTQVDQLRDFLNAVAPQNAGEKA